MLKLLKVLLLLNILIWCGANARVLGMGLELLIVHGGMFEINQMLFADGIALVADSEGKLLDW